MLRLIRLVRPVRPVRPVRLVGLMGLVRRPALHLKPKRTASQPAMPRLRAQNRRLPAPRRPPVAPRQRPRRDDDVTANRL